MRLVLGVVIVAAGCHSADRDRAPRFGRDSVRERPAPTVPPEDWTATQSAQTTKADTLAGIVVLPDGTPAKNIPLEIEMGIGQGAPVEVRTDSAGFFRIPGLKPRQSYTLIAKAAQNGTQYLGKLYARTGTEKSERLRIELAEGNAAPSAAGNGTGLPAPDLGPIPTFTPNDVAIPGPRAAAPAPAPEAFIEKLPPPLMAQNPTPVVPTVTPPPLVAVPRQDLQVANEPPIYRPPTASVPPLIGPGPRPEPKAEPTGTRKVSPTGTEFTLTDSASVPRDFPTGGWVLLDFMTTSCQPCAKAVPLLTAIQERYAAERLEVIGVCCDDADAKTRRRRMTDYAQKHRPGYPLLTEPSDDPNALLERYKIQAYPTLILIDRDGKEVWRGHPAEARELGRYLRR